MNHQTLKESVRRILVTATNINPVAQLKIDGENFDTTGKSLWVEEFVTEGELTRMTSARQKISAYIIQYDFNVPSGTSTLTAETKVHTAQAAFPNGLSIQCGDGTAIVQSTKINRSSDKQFTDLSLVITFFVDNA